MATLAKNERLDRPRNEPRRDWDTDAGGDPARSPAAAARTPPPYGIAFADHTDEAVGSARGGGWSTAEAIESLLSPIAPFVQEYLQPRKDKAISIVEDWQLRVAGAVSDEGYAMQYLGFEAFFALDLLKRAMEWGDSSFGVTELQEVADILADPERGDTERATALAWGALIIALDAMAIEGVAKGFAQAGAKVLQCKPVAWVRNSLSALLERAARMAASMIPSFVVRGWASCSAFLRGILGRIASKAAAIGRVQELAAWYRGMAPSLLEPVALPRVFEMLTLDVRAFASKRVSAEAAGLGIKGGLGARLLQDVRGARQARGISLRAKAIELGEHAKKQEKGALAEQAGRLMGRVRGYSLTPADISKIRGNQGVDLLFVKNSRRFIATEAKWTGVEGAQKGLLKKYRVRPGSPLAKHGVAAGTRYEQASAGFNLDRLKQLVAHSDPAKRKAGEIFLEHFAELEHQLVTLHPSKGLTLYRLEMSQSLLEVIEATELARITLGELRDIYYLLVVAESAALLPKGTGQAADEGVAGIE